jgi:glycerophosphoryl diester phosphodiesterase
MKTLIYAHRGASRYVPENSLPAFLLAAEQGADGIELDVRLTADGELAVFHDPTLERLCGVGKAVSELTAAELQGYDIAGAFPQYRGAKIPLLREVYDRMAHTGLRLNVEIKEAAPTPRLIRKLLALEAEFGLGDRILYSSFSAEILKHLAPRAGRDRCAYLYSHGMLSGYLGYRKTGARWMHPCWASAVSIPHVKLFQKAGLGVNAWTVDDPRQMRTIFRIGLEGVITNCPDVAVKIRREIQG